MILILRIGGVTGKNICICLPAKNNALLFEHFTNLNIGGRPTKNRKSTSKK
jgi:hypothetical protein